MVSRFYRKPAKSRLLTMPKSTMIYGVDQRQTQAVQTVESSSLYGTPEVRDPLFNPEEQFLPKSISHYNKWIRHYDMLHPLIGNSIDIHAFLPISDFSFGGTDLDNNPEIKQVFGDMKENLHLYEWLLSASREFELMGEQYSYFSWDGYSEIWDGVTVLNPDLLEIFPYSELQTGFRQYIISLEVSNELKDLRTKSFDDPRFEEVYMQLDPKIRNCIESGKTIPLSKNNVYGMQRLSNPYHKRGTSQVLRAIRDLLYEDKLRGAQTAVADGYITPIQLWKLGDPSGKWIPSEDDISAFNSTLSENQHQKFFRMVTHQYVNHSAIVPTQGMLSIIPEMDKIEDRILTALYTNKAMTGSNGPTYANSVVALKVLRGRYRNKLIRFEKIIQDLCRKVSLARGYVKRTNAEVNNRMYGRNNANLIVPEIKWEENLAFNENYDLIQIMIQLADKNKISWKKVLDSLGVDSHEEQERLKAQTETIYNDPVYQAKTEKILEMIGTGATGDDPKSEVTSLTPGPSGPTGAPNIQTDVEKPPPSGLTSPATDSENI